MVGTGAVVGCQRGRASARGSGVGECRIRTALRLHVYCVCDRQKRRGDACYSPAALEQRAGYRTAGSSRVAAPDHADSSGEMAGGMSGITTHVLDTVLGKSAAGIGIRLEKFDEGSWLLLAESATDADGRCRNLASEASPGLYRL